MTTKTKLTEQEAAIINSKNRHTEYKKSHVNTYLHIADSIRKDPLKEKRLDDSCCVGCKYIGRVETCDICEKACEVKSCDNTFTSSSAGGRRICESCCTTYSMCQYCGGDVDMKVWRVKA